MKYSLSMWQHLFVGFVRWLELCSVEFNYKNMSGSSQYKFGILAKIVKYLRVSVLFMLSYSEHIYAKVSWRWADNQ